MKKSIVKLGLVTALSASLFGFTYEIKQGWQQLGALEDLNSSDLKAFNDKCVNYLWFYDNNDSSNPQWKLHIANGNDYDYCGEELKSLKKGQGFWANAKADCNISIGTTPDKPCVSDMPAPPDLEKPECMTCDTDSNNTNNFTTTGIKPASELSGYLNTWVQGYVKENVLVGPNSDKPNLVFNIFDKVEPIEGEKIQYIQYLGNNVIETTLDNLSGGYVGGTIKVNGVLVENNSRSHFSELVTDYAKWGWSVLYNLQNTTEKSKIEIRGVKPISE